MFRYPGSLLRALTYLIVMFPLVGAVIYLTGTKASEVVVQPFAVAGALITGVIYARYKAYSVVVTREAVFVGGLRRRTIPFASIRKVHFVGLGRSDVVMRFLGDHNERLLAISDDLENFGELVSLMEAGAGATPSSFAAFRLIATKSASRGIYGLWAVLSAIVIATSAGGLLVHLWGPATSLHYVGQLPGNVRAAVVVLPGFLVAGIFLMVKIVRSWPGGPLEITLPSKSAVRQARQIG